jgi:hypothetical protein
VPTQRPDTAAPPWVLAWPVVTATLPRPAVVAVSLPPRVAIDVPWPRIRAAQDQPPPAPAVVRLAAPPQRPWRLTLPGGHPLRHPDLYDLPPRRRG